MKFYVIYIYIYIYIYEPLPYRGFAGRPPKLKWLLTSQDFLAFSAILRVNGIRRSMAKTIVTIAI